MAEKVKSQEELRKWATNQLNDHACRCEDCKAAIAILITLEAANSSGPPQ